MSEHVIRLRGGWEWWDETGEGPRRVSLPLVWPPDGPAKVRLVRSFQTPTLDPAAESLGLRIDDVPGLVAVELNGRDLAGSERGPLPPWLPLGVDLPARNRLVLHVESPLAGNGSGLWGSVALVIRRDGGGSP